MEAKMKSKAEIEHLLESQAVDRSYGASRFPSMTYEQGVRAALEWVLGEMEENPLD